MRDPRDEILDHLARIFEPGDRATVQNGEYEVEILGYHGDGHYAIRYLSPEVFDLFDGWDIPIVAYCMDLQPLPKPTE